MWPLIDGQDCLRGPEADLFRGAVGMMLDQVVLEINEIDATNCGGEDDAMGANDASSVAGITVPRLFAMWEPEQRIWLLERVTLSILGNRTPPPAAAIYEATIDAIYVEVGDLIALEICEGTPIQPSSWRQTLLDAFVARCPRDSLLEAMHFEATANDPCLPPAIVSQLRSYGYEATSEGGDELTQRPSSARQRDWFAWWAMITDRLVDATFGPRLYGQIEPLRDGDPRAVTRMLRDKGLHAHFTRRIPPLRSPGQTQASIDRLQAIIFAE